jgi:signal transduction histidine kinase
LLLIAVIATFINLPTAAADMFLGRGAVGGHLADFAAQGQVAAVDAVKILQGVKSADIPIIAGKNVFLFDWRASKRWKFSERYFSLGSIVLYREITLQGEYKRLVIATLLITSLLALLICYSLVERRRRTLAERELELEMTFQRLISELSTYFIDLRPDKVNVGIDSALDRVVGSRTIDRISMLEFIKDGRELLITHSSSGQRSAMVGSSLRSEDIPFTVAKLLKNETLVLSDLDQDPGMSAEERELMRRRGIGAGVFVPLEAGGTVLGVLSFVSQQQSMWSQKVVEHCRMLGQSFANALARMRADEALVTSELLKSAILASLGGDVTVIDHNGRILSTNQRVEREGWPPGMVSEAEFSVGANCLEIYQRANGASDPPAIETLAGIKAVLQGTRPQFEIEWSRHSPQGRQWFLTSVTPLKAPEGGAVITCSEITNRKQAEEERLELSGRLIDMQEKERSRLARELHDDFNQRLAVLAIDLERAAQTIADSPVEASQRLHELWNRASEIGTDLHSLSHRLHSSTLESLGLVLGVSSLCTEFAEQNEIQVDFTNENVGRSVPSDIALCLFRVAQEGLRNVKRHSGASRAEVRLEGSERAISLSISDKGVGFDSHTLRAGASLGIRSMQERLRLLGGHFEIRSQPGNGTMIHVSIPLRAHGSIRLAARANEESFKQA